MKIPRIFATIIDNKKFVYQYSPTCYVDCEVIQINRINGKRTASIKYSDPDVHDIIEVEVPTTLLKVIR